jgi:recombination protein RecA
MAKKKVVQEEVPAAQDTVETTALAVVPIREKRVSTRMGSFLAGELIKKINKSAGGIAVGLARDRQKKLPRISSGVFQLDFALGGGYEVGKVHTFYGPQSGGKTNSCLRAIAEAQKVCRHCYTGDYYTQVCECGKFEEVLCAFIDVEGTLNLNWAAKLGVDTDRLAVSTPEYAEQALDIFENIVREGSMDVIALDSLAFLTPAKEIEESTAKETMGVQPRVIGKGMRKLTAALNAMEMNPETKRPTIFFTNQIRMQIGVMFGNPETVSGGKAPRFIAATEARFAPGKTEIPDDGIGKPTSQVFAFKIEKNKTAVPKISGEYTMALSNVENKKLGDIMDEHDFIKLAESAKLLTGSGSSWDLFGLNFKGKAGLEHRLMYEPELKKEFYGKLMEILLEL